MFKGVGEGLNHGKSAIAKTGREGWLIESAGDMEKLLLSKALMIQGYGKGQLFGDTVTQFPALERLSKYPSSLSTWSSILKLSNSWQPIFNTKTEP